MRESRRLVGDVSTRVYEVEGSGPAVILLHGFSDHAASWSTTLAELARRGQRAVAVDLPGFGKADDFVRDEPLMAQLDRFVAELVREWTDPVAGPPVVAGNSLGGVLAVRAAQRADPPVAGIVPIAPAGFGHAWWMDVGERVPLVADVLVRPVLPMAATREVIRFGFHCFALAGAKADPVLAAGYVDQFQRRGDITRLVWVAKRMAADLRADFALHEIRCPVLLIWGKRDRITLPSGAERVLRQIPHAEYAELPDGGHCPHYQQPDRIAELLVDFAVRTVPGDQAESA